MNISGTTRLFGVLGDPIAQVQAPALLNAAFERSGRDAVLVPMHVKPEHLAEFLHGLRSARNLDGLLVTVPHKMAVCGLAERVSGAVEQAGSANALRRESDGRWYAENFDGAGFVAGLRHNGHEPAGRRVAVVGAGGAGSAIAVALLANGVSELAVFDHDRERIDRLRNRISGPIHFGHTPEVRGYDLVVNATPLGLREEDGLPFDPPDGALIADIIMKPKETRLLRVAADRGLGVHHGIHMLTHQIALYLDFFAA